MCFLDDLAFVRHDLFRVIQFERQILTELFDEMDEVVLINHALARQRHMRSVDDEILHFVERALNARRRIPA